MYPKFFGLKEPSFSIAPDPHYLYLSEQHREALAHLLYGAAEQGGFVLLTGEVGTGKTTVCRAFLGQLPEGVDVALILNPSPNPHELLLNICQELGVAVPQARQSKTALIDRLNRYLLDAYANHRRIVLIIDEAQNLPPRALEQIRLLTNLETTRHKLLQIFLIGQPELRRILQNEQLRQIDQRITARFHLTPFSLRETADYIRHRLAVAGGDRPLFTAQAVRRIYRHSGGIPRRINILCDRALLGACVTRRAQVTPSIVDQAAREVLGKAARRSGRRWLLGTAVLAVLALGTALGYSWWATGQRPDRLFFAWLDGLPSATVHGDALGASAGAPAAATVDVGVSAQPADEPAEAAAGQSAIAPRDAVGQTVRSGAEGAEVDRLPDPVRRIALADFGPAVLDATLNVIARPQSQALAELTRLWNALPPPADASEPCAELREQRLRCQTEEGRLSNVRFFDLPALLAVTGPEGDRGFVALRALSASDATLMVDGEPLRVPLAGLEQIWSGRYILLWRTPPSGSRVIVPNSPGDDIRYLRRALDQVSALHLSLGEAPEFDSALTRAVRRFQAFRGIEADGLVGPRTLILLGQSAAIAAPPSLAGTGDGAP